MLTHLLKGEAIFQAYVSVYTGARKPVGIDRTYARRGTGDNRDAAFF